MYLATGQSKLNVAVEWINLARWSHLIHTASSKSADTSNFIVHFHIALSVGYQNLPKPHAKKLEVETAWEQG